MRPRPFALAFVAVVSTSWSACGKPAVDWSDPQPIAEVAGATHLVVDAAGRARFVSDSVAVATVPPSPARCDATMRTARGTVHTFLAWWSVRADSSAILWVARSADGGRTWAAPAIVDTSDVALRGCDRPAPALATVGDDVHVAYSMAAPDGTGVFFAHFMGAMLHAPVAIYYGERLVPASVAAEGDDVAVAFEEPNGTHLAVDLALSRTLGHIFEQHLTASRSSDPATAPIVALDGNRIAVSWLERPPSDTAGARVVRLGTIFDR